MTGTCSQLVVKHDAVTGSDLEGLSLARIMFFGQLGLCLRAESTVWTFVHLVESFLSCSSSWDIVVCASIASTKRDCYVSLLLYNCYYISSFTLGKMHESISFSSLVHVCVIYIFHLIVCLYYFEQCACW